ncbi:MAG: glycosyltransferase [Patescibacteria group bacterium]|jgi:glycosyltransferase involved in cell wall biosynthesis|nr:glycosyltransferase [Patescibacteria group bacterium]
MKVAIVTDSFYAINGVSKTYQQLAKYCQTKKIKLDIFTIGQKESPTIKGCVKILEYQPVWPVKYYPDLPPFDIRIISEKFKKEFLNQDYDLIHLATPGSLGIAARTIINKIKTPVVGSFHTMVAEYANDWTKKNLEKFPNTIKNSAGALSGSVMWQFLKWFYGRTDVLLVPNQTMAERLKNFHPTIKIFPRGVDQKKFFPKLKKSTGNKCQLIALYVGRLSVEKNLDLLVDIFKNRKDIELRLVGDGPYLAGLKTQLPKAKFFGYLGGQKLTQAYQQADCFIFPSTTDTFGNVILEAQACGLPCIVTNVGGPQELINNKKNGLIAKPTVKDFNKAIDYLINNPNQRNKLGIAAAKATREKTWNQAFDKLFDIYQNLM